MTTNKELLQQILQLSPQKRARILAKLKAQGVELTLNKPLQPSTIPPVDRSLPIPLAFPQEQLWFLHQLEPDSVAYNERMAVRLEGPLDVSALEKALHSVVRRHESLRTTFAVVDDAAQKALDASSHAVQVIHPFDPDVYGLTQQLLATPGDPTQLAQRVDAVTLQPFDLTAEPLWRVVLFHIGPDTHVLLLVVHHIIADGWSMALFFQEVAAYYTAAPLGQSAQLPDLSVTYADFAGWQRQQMQGETLARQLDFWQQSLEGAPPLLPLPTDYPRPPVPSGHGSVQRFTLGQALTQQLKTLSRQSDATLYMTLLSAFNVLLYRYTGQEDLVVGSVQANRAYPELEPLIGHFVNTLVWRTQLPSQATFHELLQQMREQIQASYEHQALPFQTLVQAIQPERTLGHHPLYQVSFNLHNQPGLDGLSFADLHVAPLSLENQSSKLDLYLLMYEEQGELSGEFEYNTDIFASATIERMAGHFQTLLAGIVADPNLRLSELPLLTEAERHQLLVSWNDTVTDYPQDKCIYHLFEEQVARRPDAVAVVYTGDTQRTCFDNTQQLTYHELNTRANQLAHHLISLGVGPEVLVGICVERSLEMVVGLLAILKAGGAYVPLDPTYPTERLTFMLQDASVPVLLTQQHLAYNLPPTSAQLICLDSDWTDIAKQDSHISPHSQVQPHNLAYVIYTSGSTGQPKGVMVEHDSLVNHINTVIDKYRVTEADRVLQFASTSFDVSLEQIFVALGSGAGLFVRGDDFWTAEKFDQQVLSHGLTVADIPPVYFRQLIQHWQIESPPFLHDQLRLIIVGGEKISPETVKLWSQLSIGNVQLLNAYGPTETTITATCFDLKDSDWRSNNVPIGQALPNRTVYILAPTLQPTPIGAPGELHIGGECVARGYLNRVELTAERFIGNPFADSGQLYKSGDLARWLPDGNIEFLGRIDHQVKIRGFRIELGEIEAVLTQHPEVQEAVVIAREDEPGQKRLVGYVVGRKGDSTTALRDHLLVKLPDYMLPSAFVALDALPLTPNGKVDRQALPAPTTTDLGIKLSPDVPRTARAATLALIWQQVLRLEAVGIDDNFFNIGGDSIISIQVVARARQAGLQITPRQLFQHPTIRQLAAVATPISGAPTAPQEAVTGALPLTPIQQWFLEQEWQEPHHFNQSMLLETAATVNPLWLEAALTALLHHHDALRLRFHRVDHQWQQVNMGTLMPIAFEVIDLASMIRSERLALLTTEANRAQATLQLDEGPLLRAVLFTCGKQEAGRLLLVIHHLAVDGVSWRILLEDLQTAYQQRSRDEHIKLPAKTTAFRDWAHWLASEGVKRVAAEQAWWQSTLRELKGDLPVDWPDGVDKNTVNSVQDVVCVLSAAETEALLHEAPAAYHTQINDLLLTALAQAISQWTGSESVALDLEGHGRELLTFDTDENATHDLDLSRTVGWFTSLFPVVLHLDQAESGALIKSIKEQLRRIPNRGIGYGILRYLALEPELQSAEPVGLSFNYLGQFDATLQQSTSQNDPLFLAFADEASGEAWSPTGRRTHLLDINAMLMQGELRFVWSYSQHIHQRATIERLAQQMLSALRQLIAHCCSPDAGGYTPSDFSAPDLDQVELDELLAQFAM